MNDDQILALIREALTSVAPQKKADFAKADLKTSIKALGLDSIATMEMVGVLEEKVGATFPDEDLATVASLGDLATLVRRKS